MELSRPQLVVIAAVLVVVLFFVGVFTGIIPGLKVIPEAPPRITLTIWGVDDPSWFENNFKLYKQFQPNITVDYKKVDPETLEIDLINALATKKGPDIVSFHSSWLPKHSDKIIPAKEDQISVIDLDNLFPGVIKEDFSSLGKIYALPLYIDTLALFYNRDIFDKNGIALEPQDWLDFQNIVDKLRRLDSLGNLVKPAAAIGGSNNSMDKASDLLMLLLLQAGTKMTNEEFTEATFTGNVEGRNAGLDGLNFYTKFSNSKDLAYTWNDDQEYSLNSFAKGNLAMIFNYASQRKTILAKNPFLNFRVAAMPQPSTTEKAVNYPDYWGLAVTNNSQNPDWAWNLVLFLTTYEKAAEDYLIASDNPPALRSLIQKYANHPELGVFVKQALSAKSWPRIDKEPIDQIFSGMIGAVVSGKLKPLEALSQGEKQVTELMQRGK
ncbi:MAG: extracellular solute-binding protein [Candidatus Harrisonbacteria bacterium]|nr:extracellular solute-binding protein [Candidatus Harrisonbacteria bacterium]